MKRLELSTLVVHDPETIKGELFEIGRGVASHDSLADKFFNICLIIRQIKRIHEETNFVVFVLIQFLFHSLIPPLGVWPLGKFFLFVLMAVLRKIRLSFLLLVR